MRARMRQERSCQMSRGTASADEQIEAGRAERLLERGFKAVRLRTTSCAGMCSRLSIEALELPARDHAGAVWRQIPAPLSWVEAGLSRAAFLILRQMSCGPFWGRLGRLSNGFDERRSRVCFGAGKNRSCSPSWREVATSPDFASPLFGSAERGQSGVFTLTADGEDEGDNE